MMKELLFPWESRVMIENPWAMPIFMVVFSLFLSIITWIREGRS